jgi:hypothetical protein
VIFVSFVADLSVAFVADLVFFVPWWPDALGDGRDSRPASEGGRR